MSAIDRPDWCPDPECTCLTGFAERICVGRLPQKVAHDDLFNTHNLCLERESLGEENFCEPINDADAWYFSRCMQAVRKDVEQAGLYRPPGLGETWGFKRGEA